MSTAVAVAPLSLARRLVYAVAGLAVVYSVTLWTLTTTVEHAGAAAPMEVVMSFDRLAIDERKPREAVMQYVAEDFVDHDPETGGTRDGLLKLLEGQGRWAVGEMKREVAHVLSNGDVIAIHQRITVKPGDPAMEAVDIFRVNEGRIVEHWGVSQQESAP